MFRLSAVEAPNQFEAGLDKELEHNQQRHDAAEIPHSPAEAAHLADVPRGGDLGEHGVVVDPGKLEEDVAQRYQRDAEDQEVRPREDKEAQPGQERDGGRVDPQPQLAPAAGVRALPGDRGQEGDGHAGDGQRGAQDRRGLVLPAECLGGQIDGENERCHDGVEGCRTPVPRGPREDPAPVRDGTSRFQFRGAHGLWGGGSIHSLNVTARGVLRGAGERGLRRSCRALFSSGVALASIWPAAGVPVPKEFVHAW